MWTSNPSGDYSGWKRQLDDAVDAHCADSGSMVKGLSLFGSTLARKFFVLFSSDWGRTSLTNAIRDHNVSAYLKEHPAFIIAWVLGVFVLILSILLALSLIRCWRKGCRKIGCCVDRPRVPFHELKASTYNGTVAVALALFVVLFALSIGTFVHVGYAMEGFKGATCDMWQALRSHYFGAQTLAVEENVVHDWKGSNAQREAMVELRESVNPNQPNGGRCPACEMVEKHYSGPGGLVDTVSTSRNAVVDISYGMAILWNVMRDLNSDVNNVKDLPNVDGVVKFSAANVMYYDTALPELLSTYADQLDKTTDDGIKLFREMIDKYLGSTSPLLRESYTAADTSITSLADVDYVMANAVQKWDTAYPTLAVLTRLLVAVGAIIGIFACAIPIMGCIIGWFLHGRRKDQLLPSRTLTQLTGALYAMTIILAGVAFCFGTIYLSLSQIGSDTCGFVNTVVYEDGNWRILPEDLWKTTPSQRTDMATVLDTCVKDTGDGDIASSLGIRMLLEKLTQSVTDMQEEVLKTTEIRLDLDFKSEKTNSLSYITSRTPQLLFNLPYRIEFGEDTRKHDEPDDSPDDEYPVPEGMTRYEIRDDLFAVRPDGDDEIIPASCAPRLLIWLKTGQLPNIFTQFTAKCYRHLILLSSGASAGFGFLNQIAKEAHNNGTFPFQSFCVRYLADDGVCQAADDVYMIDGTFDIPTRRWAHNPFADQHIQKLITDLSSRPTDRYTLTHMLATYLYFDRFFQQTLTYDTPVLQSADDVLPLLERLPSLFPDPENWGYGTPFRKFVNVLLNIPECADTETQENRCTVRRVHKAFVEKGKETAKALERGFTVANGAVMGFVHNVTLATAWGQINAAKGSLRHLNCQFLGTALYEGARADLCDVLFPNIASLGLVALLVWSCACLASIVIWRAYLYLNNLHQYGDIRTMKTTSAITATASKISPTE